MNPGELPPSRPNWVVRALMVIAGLGAGLFVGWIVFAVACYFVIRHEEPDIRRGWFVVPVLVAAQDIPAGTVLTKEMITQRSYPDQWRSAGDLPMNHAESLPGRTTVLPLSAGDPIRWIDLKPQ